MCIHGGGAEVVVLHFGFQILGSSLQSVWGVLHWARFQWLSLSRSCEQIETSLAGAQCTILYVWRQVCSQNGWEGPHSWKRRRWPQEPGRICDPWGRGNGSAEILQTMWWLECCGQHSHLQCIPYVLVWYENSFVQSELEWAASKSGRTLGKNLGTSRKCCVEHVLQVLSLWSWIPSTEPTCWSQSSASSVYTCLVRIENVQCQWSAKLVAIVCAPDSHKVRKQPWLVVLNNFAVCEVDKIWATMVFVLNSIWILRWPLHRHIGAVYVCCVNNANDWQILPLSVFVPLLGPQRHKLCYTFFM